MRLLTLALFLPLGFGAPCATVDRDRIIAGDVVKNVPAFSGLDPDVVIGLAPMPGARRTLSGHDLDSIAKRHGISLEGPVTDVCFERKLAPLTVERIRAALESTLGSPTARLEILDVIRQPMPSGDLVFTRDGLTPPPSARPESTAFWRGTIRYSPQHTLGIWAKVRITEDRPVLIAARQIRYGTTITAEDLELANRSLFPFTPHLESRSDAVGRVARKTIPPGALIQESFLDIPPEVAVGETVRVMVTNGSARITLDAVARSPGRKGGRILLLNPDNQKTFHAIVDDRRHAHVGAGT